MPDVIGEQHIFQWPPLQVYFTIIDPGGIYFVRVLIQQLYPFKDIVSEGVVFLDHEGRPLHW